MVSFNRHIPPTPPTPPSNFHNLHWDPDASEACGQAYVGVTNTMEEGDWSPGVQNFLKGMLTPYMERIEAGFSKLTGKDLQDATPIYRQLHSLLFDTGGLFDSNPKTGPTTIAEALAIAGDRSAKSGTVTGGLISLEAIFERQD